VAIIALAAATVACSTNPRPVANLTPAPAPGTGLASADCFRSLDVRNHTVVDKRTLLIDVQRKGTYRLTASNSCLSGASNFDPIITRQPPGRDIICRPIDTDIAIGRDGFQTPCIIESIVKLTPAEVAALPPKLKP
jgi:hypothetical protein